MKALYAISMGFSGQKWLKTRMDISYLACVFAALVVLPAATAHAQTPALDQARALIAIHAGRSPAAPANRRTDS
jgi:hypothetical protein